MQHMRECEPQVPHVLASCAADANILIESCRLTAQRYLATYQEPMPCEQLVRQLCDIKQAYTQRGGQRPFGVSLLYAGWCVLAARRARCCRSVIGCLCMLPGLITSSVHPPLQG